MNIFKIEEVKNNLESDLDYERLFIKVAKEEKLNSFSELSEKIANLTNNDVSTMKSLERWGKKLELDMHQVQQDIYT
jgi:hypothetical protein